MRARPGRRRRARRTGTVRVPRHRGPPRPGRRPARAARRTARRRGRAAGARPRGVRSARSPLGAWNSAAAAATASATYAPLVGASSIASCCIGSPRRSTTQTETARPSARGPGDHRVRESAGPVEVGLLRGGRGGRHAHARGRLVAPGAERRGPASEVVAVLADVLLLERVRDEEVLGVGGPAVGQHHLGVEARRDERADGGARRRDARHDPAVAADRHAARARERRLGRDEGEAGRDRGRDHAEAVQVLGARDALGRRDPGLGAGSAHAAGAAVVHP